MGAAEADAGRAIGGVPAHLYESSPSGDALAGAGLEYRPVRELLLGADHFFVRDRRSDGPDSEDHLTILRARYRLGESWALRSQFSWVGDRDRRQLIDLRYLSPEYGTQVILRGLRQNGIVDFLSDELSTYQLIQGSYAPYYQVQLDASQPLGEHFAVGGGVQSRHLEDSSDEGLFNREFRNVYLTLDVERPWPGARLSLRGDLWDASDEDVHGLGFELDQELGEFLRARIGTSYSLYRFDEFTGTERERDRQYYVRLDWKLGEGLQLDTDYVYERDSSTEYHRFSGGFRLWF